MDKDREELGKEFQPLGEESPRPIGAPVPPAGVTPQPGTLKESRLISFGDRITYTFIWAKEVQAIHFDRKREEIFYRGHNIRNMDLIPEQVKLLQHFKGILARDLQNHGFAVPYEKTLQKLLREKGYAVKV